MPIALPPPDPGFEILVSSTGMSQGIAQTDGVQIRPRAYLRIGAARIGVQWRNIDSRLASGVAALTLKYSREFGRAEIEVNAAYRVRTGVKLPHDSRAWEFEVDASRSFGRFSVRAGAEYTPRDFESGRSLYVDVGPTFDVDAFTRIAASLGRRERIGGPDYTSFNAGISTVVKRRLTLDVRYYRTNRSELGERFGERIVVSGRLKL